MISPLAKTAHEAYLAAAPYIQNLEWLNETLQTLLSAVSDLSGLRKALEEIKTQEGDVTRRTDLNVYLSTIDRLAERLDL